MKNVFTTFFLAIFSFAVVYGQNCTLEAGISAPTTIICAGSTITLTANPKNGTAPYTYTWSTGETTQSITITAAGNYTVDVADATPGCAPVRAQLAITNPSFPTANDANICEGNSATLRASGATDYRWFDDAAITNQVGSGATFSTPALTTSTTYYLVATNNGCQAPVKAVRVNVTPIPAPPTVPNAAICSGDRVTLSVSSPSGLYDWFDVPTGGSSLITSPDFTTPALTANKTYYVQTYGADCTSQRTAVTVTVNPRPQNPIGVGATVCYGSPATLSVSNAANLQGTINWYDASFGNNVVGTGATFTTPALLASKTYYVQVSNEFSCSSNRVAVIAAVKPEVPHPTAPGVLVCTGTTALLRATSTQNGATFAWYSAETGGTLLASTANYTTPTITGRTLFYVESSFNGCTSPRTEVVVDITNTPDQPTVQPPAPLCAGSSAVLVANGTAANFQWYDAATGGNLQFTGQTFTTPPLAAGVVSYWLQGVNGQCPGARTQVTITVKAAPVAPTVTKTPTRDLCTGESATLSAGSPSSPVTWFDAATGGNALFTGNTFTTPALAATTTFYAESSNGDCTSARTPVTVNVTTIPDPVFSYSPDIYCKASGIINSNRPAVAQFTRTAITYTGDAGLIINPATGIINVQGSTAGTHTITANITGNQCIQTASTTVSIVNAATSAAPFNYPQASYCQFDANPTPVIGAGGSGRFSSGPGLVFVDTGTGEIDLSKSAPGTYVVRNTTSCNGTSLSSTSTTVIIKLRPVVDAGIDKMVAIGAVVNLAGTITPTGNTAVVQWTVVSGNGQLTNANKLEATYIPATGETATTLALSTVGQECPSQDQVIISYAPLVPPTAPDVTICQGGTAVLTATASSGATFNWYTMPTGGVFVTENPHPVTPNVTTTYYVAAVVNGVISERTAVTVNVNAAPIPTITGTTICFDSRAVLKADAGITTGGTYQWLDGDGNLLATGASYTTTFLQANTRYFLKYNLPNGCNSPTIPVDITVNPLPQITSAITASTCSGEVFNYNITGSPQSTVFTWARAAVTGINNSAASATSNVISETLDNPGVTPINVTYVITATSATCNARPFNLVVTVNPALSYTSSATDTICDNTASNYAVKLNFTPTSISWSRASVPGITNAGVTDQTSPVIRETLHNNSAAPVKVTYVYTALSGDCRASTLNYQLTVNPTAVITSATALTVCSGTALAYKITANVAGSTFRWTRNPQADITPAGATGTTDVINETLINTGQTPRVVRYTLIPIFGGCEGTPQALNVTVNPTPQAIITTNSPVCTQTTLTLSTPAVAGATYLWTGPNNFTSTVQNPSIPNAQKINAGEYTLTVSLRGCVSVTNKTTVAVNQQPIVVAGVDPVVCASSVVQLAGSVTGDSNEIVWSTNGSGTFTPSANVLNAIYNPSEADKQMGTIQLTLSSLAFGNCAISTSTLKITLVPLPVVNTGGDQDICIQDKAVKLNAVVSNANSMKWSTDGSGTFSPSNTIADPTYVMSAADKSRGFVTLSLTALNDYCTVTETKKLTFVPPPTVDAGTGPIYLLKGTKYTFTPKVSGANNLYLWSPSDFLDDASRQNAVATGTKDILYTLTVTDRLGCVTSDTISIIALDPIIPYNTFTPNGDGYNDFWNIPSLIKYPGAVVDIYNRYGKQFFHSNGYNVPWDGTYEGQPVPLGVYYYVIRTKFSDQIFSGYVTVIR